jgi:hypothetical protein
MRPARETPDRPTDELPKLLALRHYCTDPLVFQVLRQAAVAGNQTAMGTVSGGWWS